MPKPMTEKACSDVPDLADGGAVLEAPFVVRNLAADWPVVAAARSGDAALLAYLSAMATGEPVDYVSAAAATLGRLGYDARLTGFNFTRHTAPLAIFLKQLAEAAAIDQGDVLAAQGIVADRFAPGFATANRFDWLPQQAQARLWIGNRAVVAIHSDPADNVACVAAGRRTFTLFEPGAVGDLGMGPFDPTPAGTPISLADPLAPDLDRFPRFAEALERALSVTLEPGDAIFIPYGWYHHVQSHDPVSMLVNHWWNTAPSDGGSPWDAMLHAIMTIRHLPAPQRQAWLAMFRHYAFLADGDPAAHIPEHAAGILRRPPSGPRDDAAHAAPEAFPAAGLALTPRAAHARRLPG